MQLDLIEEILTGELTDRQYLRYLTGDLHAGIIAVLTLPEPERAALQAARERQEKAPVSRSIVGGGNNVLAN